MTKSQDLVGLLHAQIEPIHQKVYEEIKSFELLKVVPKSMEVVPGLTLSDGEGFISEEEHLGVKNRITNLKEDLAVGKKIAEGTDAFILPTSLFLDFIRSSRLLYIYSEKDNIYTIPDEWRKEIMHRRSRLGSLTNPSIKSIDLNEAFPGGVIKSYGIASEFKDRVEITLPQPPKVILSEMLATLNTLPAHLKPKICVIADPKCVGTTLFLAKQKPVRIKPRDLDPGLVLEYGNFVIIYPKTFYNLSKLEYGILNIFAKASKKWDAQKFVTDTQN